MVVLSAGGAWVGTLLALSLVLLLPFSPKRWNRNSVTIRGLLYAKEMTFRERMARLQFSDTLPMAWRGRMWRVT